MDIPTLQWSGAEVRDGILTVEIDGDRPKGWKATFEKTVRLLGGGDWGEVTLKSGKVRVSEVREGSEGQLRHFLEGAVQEANAAFVDEAEDHEDDGKPESEVGDDADARMTGRFRDFDAA